MTFDLESLQLRVKQLQEELDKSRRSWGSEREEFHLRESKLEANLTVSKRANTELEVSACHVLLHVGTVCVFVGNSHSRCLSRRV